MRAWPFAPLALLVLGVAVLALPAEWEGAVLVPISPGHGLSALDMAGALPVAVAGVWVQAGLWRRRGAIATWMTRAPLTGAATWLIAGAGLGLLIASSFSTFWWWWAIGALLLTLAAGHLVRRTMG